uniref:G-protein coupled receptors family 1 profile domain-containing protein n=1 Tax=Podarcis muralis TaxID=64176 RepID=A0A670JY35_PODMU
MGNVGFGVLLAILASLILVMNALVVVALVRLISKGGCLGLCFCFNLAVADFLVGFTITRSDHRGAVRSLKWPASPAPQLPPSSLFILVTFDRYLAVKHPFQYFKIMRSPVVGACITGLWLLACLVGFLPVMAHSFQADGYTGLCTFFRVFQPTYMLTFFCVAFFPAFFVFIYFHCHLLKIASLHAQQIREREHIGLEAALRTITILVGCFVLSWSPFFVGSIVQVACQHCSLQRLLEKYLWVMACATLWPTPWSMPIGRRKCAFKSTKSPLEASPRAKIPASSHVATALSGRNSCIV